MEHLTEIERQAQVETEKWVVRETLMAQFNLLAKRSQAIAPNELVPELPELTKTMMELAKLLFR